MGFYWASVSRAGEIHPSRAGVVTLPYFCGDVLSRDPPCPFSPAGISVFGEIGLSLDGHAGGHQPARSPHLGARRGTDGALAVCDAGCRWPGRPGAAALVAVDVR